MKAAIYCRLSAEDRNKRSSNDDSVSIRNQKDMLMKYAIRNGWEIYGIYSDEDYSGADRNRPEFNRLIQDAKSGKFDAVLCKSQSRFTREVELTEQYIHTVFPSLGIRFITLVDNADTQVRGNKKSRQINGLVNEWFLEELSDSIKSVLTSRRERGIHIGSFAPYGYAKNPNRKGHLIIDQEAAAVVGRIFTLYLEGKGKRTIARTLNEEGIPNPTEYKRLRGMNRNQDREYSTLWSYVTITGILTNEVYIGNMVQGKSGSASFKTQKKVSYPEKQWIAVTGTHEPIIDRETWDKTQAMIKSRATEPRTQPNGIFAGKVRCAGCGSGMHSVKHGERRGFRCNRHAAAPNACAGGFISLQKLQRIVLEQVHLFSEEFLDEELLETGIEPFRSWQLENAELESEIWALNRKMEAVQSAMKEQYLLKIRQRITDAEYTIRQTDITQKKSIYENTMAELQNKRSKIQGSLANKEEKSALISGYKDCRDLSKEMVAFLIDYIEIGKTGPTSKETAVVIHWNF